ncbi:acyl-CoA thioesterase [Isoalcanivorax beigongshangi]|uniref:Acyl-CoA thioesterase n=1 Tax=Isoalcanivorax beigongshangi TaxID=3238810 RepID=A0ABV4AHZ7_9GAMM
MIEWDLPTPHILSWMVEPEAIDELGHANNAAYIRWLEQVAWSHTEALGLGLDVYRQLNRCFVARRTEVEYLAPAFEGERLQLGTWIVENDRRISMVRQYQVVREQDGVTLLRGNTRWVCVAMDSGKPRRMPHEFIDGYPLTQKES